MIISKNRGRYDLCSTEEEWCVSICVLDDGLERCISEIWPLDDEPDIDNQPPSEVIELIAERVERHLVSAGRPKDREIIQWVRENAEHCDDAWARQQIQRLERRREALATQILSLQQHLIPSKNSAI